MSNEIAGFLHARLDEAEAEAQFGELLWGETVADNGLGERRDHALREVEAKRAIVALHKIDTAYMDSRDAEGRPVKIPELTCYWCGWASDIEGSGCATLRILAAIYGDHPDYRQEWRP